MKIDVKSAVIVEDIRDFSIEVKEIEKIQDGDDQEDHFTNVTKSIIDCKCLLIFWRPQKLALTIINLSCYAFSSLSFLWFQ